MLHPNDLRGLPQAQQFAAAAKFAGVEPSVLQGIWQAESSSGKKMLSPAHARGHFGLMDATRATWAERLGAPINPNDFADSLAVAANQMHENLGATGGNLTDALRMYNAGTKRSRWNNKETRDYPSRVLGGVNPAEVAYEPPPTNVPSLTALSTEEILYGHYGIPIPEKTAHVKSPSQKELDNAAFDPVQLQNNDTSVVLDDSAAQAAKAAKIKSDSTPIFGDVFNRPQGDHTYVDSKVAAGLQDTLMSSMVRALARQTTGDEDPTHTKWLADHYDQVYKDAGDRAYADDLFKSKNSAEYAEILKQKQAHEAAGETLSQGADQMIYSGLGFVADPTAWLPVAVTDGGFAAARVGIEALPTTSRIMASTLARATEGAVTNTAITGAQGALGDHKSFSDYVDSFGTGLVLGGLAGGVEGVSGALESHGIALKEIASKEAQVTIAAALKEAGPGASSEAIAAKIKEVDARPLQNFVSDINATGKRADAFPELGEADQVLYPRNPEDVLLKNDKSRNAAKGASGLDNTAGPEQRNVSAEFKAHADKVMAENPIDQKGLTSVSGFLPGAQSTGMTLLKSNNTILQAVGSLLLESTTGAGGRRMTAAIVRDQQLNRFVSLVQDADRYHDVWIKGQGVNIVDNFLTQNGSKAFHREVYYETLRRGMIDYVPHESAAIREAADMYERGFHEMNLKQRAAGTVGNARLPESSHGYLPQKMSVAKIDELFKNKEATRAVLDEMSQQFQDIGLNDYYVTNALTGKVEQRAFDREFSDELARRYINHARNKVAGLGEVNMNIYDADASDTFRDTLKAMGVTEESVNDMMGQVARGGANHTKTRLNFDMFKTIPDGKGGTMRLGDLFEQDMNSLYYNYAKRTAGEIALAQYNILGKNGLKAIYEAARNTGEVTVKETEAFNQIAAEFLGTPLMNKRIAAIDTGVAFTSAARLGKASFNALGAMSNGIASLGVSRFLQSVPEFAKTLADLHNIRAGKSINPILKDFDKEYFTGLSDYHVSRLFDINDNIEMYGAHNVSVVGRAVRNLAKGQAILNFQRRITAAQTRLMSEEVLKKAFWYIKHGKEDVALKDMGLSDKLRATLSKHIDTIAEFKEGKLSALNLENSPLSPKELVELRSVMERGANQIIQRTYIGEVGPWVNDSFLRALYQFRSVSITAMEKQWSRNVFNQGHLKAFAALTASMSFAIPIQMARVYASSVGMSDSERKKYFDLNLTPAALGLATLNYADASGLMGDLSQAALGVASSVSPEAAKATQSLNLSRKGGNTKSFLGDTVAPSVGTVEDIWDAAHNVTNRPDKLIKLLPGSNLLYINPLVNAIKPDTTDSDLLH